MMLLDCIWMQVFAADRKAQHLIKHIVADPSISNASVRETFMTSVGESWMFGHTDVQVDTSFHPG